MDVCVKLRRSCFPWHFQLPSFSRHFTVFRIFLYLHNCSHIALIHLVWKQISYFTETVSSQGRKTLTSWQNTRKEGQTVALSPTLACPPHCCRLSVRSFEPCGTAAEMKKVFPNTHPAPACLWHIDFSRPVLLCLVQWVYATQTFLLYWFSLSVRLFDFFCLFV